MATVNLQVAQSSDDALENNLGTVTLDGSYPLLDSALFWVGLRFQNVAIPQGATINSASLQLYLTAAHDEVHVDVYAQDVDDAPTFTTANGDVSGRSRTTAKVDWDQAGAGVGWEAVDVSSLVQAIVDRPAWASGNDLALILDGQAGVDMSFWAYDVSPGDCPKLDVDFTPPGSGGGQPVQLRGLTVPHIGRQWQPGRAIGG